MRVSRNRCPQSKTSSRASGMRWARIRALRQRHEGIVCAGHHERRLSQPVQPEQARPTGERVQLARVAAQGGRDHALRDGGDHALIVPQVASVDRACDPLEEARVGVTPRGRHPQHHARTRRHHPLSRRGGCEHQPRAPLRVLEGDLLGERAAPRHAEEMCARDVERFQEIRDERREMTHAAHARRRRRGADAGQIEGDHATGARAARATAPAAPCSHRSRSGAAAASAPRPPRGSARHRPPRCARLRRSGILA